MRQAQAEVGGHRFPGTAGAPTREHPSLNPRGFAGGAGRMNSPAPFRPSLVRLWGVAPPIPPRMSFPPSGQTRLKAPGLGLAVPAEWGILSDL